MALSIFYDHIITFHKNNSPVRQRLQNGLGSLLELTLDCACTQYLSWNMTAYGGCVLIKKHYTVSG